MYDIICKKGRTKGGQNPMKKVITMTLIFLIMLSFSITFATEINVTERAQDDKVYNIKEESSSTLDSYVQKYGSDSYGMAAYVLRIISIYSIPVCFLGTAVGAIAYYALGTRRLDMKHKGTRMMMMFITLLVIAQVMPLIFALVVRGWVKGA